MMKRKILLLSLSSLFAIGGSLGAIFGAQNSVSHPDMVGGFVFAHNVKNTKSTTDKIYVKFAFDNKVIKKASAFKSVDAALIMPWGSYISVYTNKYQTLLFTTVVNSDLRAYVWNNGVNVYYKLNFANN